MSPDSPLSPSRHWGPTTRIAFRFSVVYFSIYVILTQMLGSLLALPDFEIPAPGFVRAPVSWVASHIFLAKGPLVIDGSGSGDKTFDWVFVFCLLMVASVMTAAWSVLDRRHQNYTRLQQWFRVFARFALGATMLSYGMVKIIPLQMSSPPALSTLVEPFGSLTPMGVLWASIGASPTYETFAGCAEVLGGILMCLPGLATLGAIVCLVDCVQIFTLNMTYDVPVKLFSFHLMVLSLVILAPELSRLVNTVVLNRASGASTQEPLGRTVRARRNAVFAQIAFAAYLLSMNLWSAERSRVLYGDLAPATPLNGIWAIEAMAVDGQPQPPTGAAADRWRRFIIQGTRTVVVQRMDDSFTYYLATIDLAGRSISLTGEAHLPPQQLKFTQPRPDTLTLDGTLDGKALHIETTLLDHKKFLLLARGFHWVQEYPFNR